MEDNDSQSGQEVEALVSEQVHSQHVAGWSVEQSQPKDKCKQVALSEETKRSSRPRLWGHGWTVRWERPQLH